MIHWPSRLVEDIARGRCIFVVGSGVSASSSTADGRKPRDWKSFLQEALTRYLPTHSDFSFIQGLIDSEQYLLALQAIKRCMDSGTYYSLIEEEFSFPDYEPSDVHDAIVDIGPKVIVTTNFDLIIEKAIPRQAFRKVIYNNANNFTDLLRSNTQVLVYAHGNVDDINKIVFTKEQYFVAKKDYPEFYNILEAIFMTNTILFLGCGLNDPDMSLLLENVFIRTNTTLPHYNAVKAGIHEIRKEDWLRSYNIETVEYGTDYADLGLALKVLNEDVNNLKLKHGL